MPHIPIDSSALLGLLQPQETYTSAQSGPLRWFDKEMRCVHTEQHGSRHYNCGASTYIKLEGVPTCSMHALRKMNEMLTKEREEQHATV